MPKHLFARLAGVVFLLMIVSLFVGPVVSRNDATKSVSAFGLLAVVAAVLLALEGLVMLTGFILGGKDDH